MFDLGYYQVHSQDKALWALVDKDTGRIIEKRGALSIFSTRAAAREELKAEWEGGFATVKRIVLL